jgi:hypothetical protein
MEQDSSNNTKVEEYGEISNDLPFPKVLSQYYVPRDPEEPSYIQSFSIDDSENVKNLSSPLILI